MRKSIVTAVAAVAGLVLVVTPGLAAQRSSISLVLLSRTTADAGASLHVGDQVTFEISTNADRPQVNAECFQNGERVYSEWEGFFDGAVGDRVFKLGPTPSWSGGAADCTARIVEWSSNGRQRTLASTRFSVAG